ncbi:MAG: FAD-dependent oxidoreductase [Thermodesulfobacteriota bacterium]
MNTYPLLFSPLTINQLTLRNRIVMPAIHLNYTPGGKVSDQLVAFYAERAQGGAGLMIVGGCAINELAGGPIFVSIKDDDDIPGLSRLAQAAHDHGAAIGVQLYMAGAYSHQALIGQQAVSASPHTSRFTKEDARELSIEEIDLVQNDFARAALRAKKAGMDMVEILGSAGYLICQFLSPRINRRTDRYGGSLENRMRFGLETIAKVRAAVGPEFCVGIRIAGNDFVPESHTNAEAAIFAKACEQAGVDLINVTGGWHETLVPQITSELPAAGFSYLARGVRRAVTVPVAASNRIHSPGLAEDILARGDADLACMCRPLLADPNLPKKAQAGRPELIRRCIACNQGCFDAVPLLQPVGCTVNPRAGREAKAPRDLPPARQPQTVVVVGGGPAGCMAAIAAARRGHHVILLEAAPRLGGQPAWYAEAVAKPDFASIAQWQGAQLADLGVDVRLGCQADLEAIAALEPDSVILATGARPARPDIPGLELPMVADAWDVLRGQVRPRGRVVVIGGGAVGLETALNVARRGALTPEQVYFLALFRAEAPQVVDRLVAEGSHPVTVLEALPKIGQGIGRSTRWVVFGQLKRFGVETHTKVKVLAVQEKGVQAQTAEGERFFPAETVILAAGARPVDELAAGLKARGVNVVKVGDAAGGGSVLAAVAQGYQAGGEV